MDRWRGTEAPSKAKLTAQRTYGVASVIFRKKWTSFRAVDPPNTAVSPPIGRYLRFRKRVCTSLQTIGRVCRCTFAPTLYARVYTTLRNFCQLNFPWKDDSRTILNYNFSNRQKTTEFPKTNQEIFRSKLIPWSITKIIKKKENITYFCGLFYFNVVL